MLFVCLDPEQKTFYSALMQLTIVRRFNEEDLMVAFLENYLEQIELLNKSFKSIAFVIESECVNSFQLRLAPFIVDNCIFLDFDRRLQWL